MSAPAANDSPSPKSAGRNSALTAFAGGLAGMAAYLLACFLVMNLAPRRDEGIRSVIALPWPVYAWLPSVVSVGAVLVASRFFRQRTGRLGFLISGLSMVAAFSYLGWDLLRRDWIGKL